MKTDLDCIPCFYGSLRTVMEEMGVPLSERESVVKRYLCAAGAGDFSQTPPRFGGAYWKLLVELSEDGDPMRRHKREGNEIMLRYAPDIKARIEAAEDPLYVAMLYAIAGNVLDPVGGAGLDVLGTLEKAAQTPLSHDDSKELFRRVSEAKHILYLTDNAGEVVADKLFLETLQKAGLAEPGAFTVATRGGPVINDALREDAVIAGIPEVAHLIDTGEAMFGVDLETCSAGFLKAWEEAELVIAKGMGNYETMNDWKGKPICFLLMAKCAPVARALGLPRNSFVCRLHNGDGR